ncbi:MAG: hypothetical protein QHI48_11700, partial [Bacteroidota bacterium]|nr:hypothetical protein [Bacteroidota bacterium]
MRTSDSTGHSRQRAARRPLGGYLLVVPFLAGMLCAESRGQLFETGIAGGYDFGVPLELERDPARISWCRGTGKGTSSSHAFWLGVFAHAPTLISAGLGGIARFTAEYSSGKFRSEQYMTTPFYDPIGNRVISALARFDARAEFFSLRGDALLTAALTDYVTAEIGPWVRYRPG